MTRIGARSSIGVTFATMVLAACAAGPTATPGASSTGIHPTASPITSRPTATPASTIPSGSPVACPSDLPTDLASVDDLADPACYGSTELTIDGWLAEQAVFFSIPETAPSWTMSISGIFAGPPVVRDWLFDLLMVGPVSGLGVVTPPETGIDVSGRGRWVRLRGHFNDPVASACTVVTSTDDEGPGVPPECARLFVISTLEDLERPDPSCPSGSPLALRTFLDADATCFLGQEVRVTGWEDVGEGFGGTGAIYPITIDPSLELAEAQFTSRRWEGDGDIDAIFTWLISDSDIRFDRSDVRVVVTGHYGHAISERCRLDPSVGWTWAPPESWAQHRCEHLFVITGVRDRG